MTVEDIEEMDLILARYEGWLHAKANQLVGVGHPLHDDLVNEGRIRMWQQAVKHGGEHAGYMTGDALRRMRQVAGLQGERAGSKQLGGEKVNSRQSNASSVKPVTTIEALRVAVPGFDPGDKTDFTQGALLAYHRGDIATAIALLSEAQRRATTKIMTDEPMTARDRAAWSDAKPKLRESLAHLQD